VRAEEEIMEYLITIYTVGSDVTTIEVMSDKELFIFIQKQIDEEPEHREKFTVKQIGEIILDLS
jgi:hypothetical protein